MSIATEPITRDQELFYKALFEGSKDFIEVRLLHKDEKPQTLFFTLKELMNYPVPQNKNVYIGIFQRGKKGSGKIEDCTKTNAIYLDFDGMELTEINYRIDMTGLPQPSMTVNSGHGYHCYWLLEEAAGREVEPIIKSMQKLLEADAKATDPARILRVPDTMNVKGDPVKCELIELNDRRTPLKAFEAILKVKARAESIERTAAIPELLSIRYNGLDNMAAGVEKGERNFCAGRIVQTLKRLNYTKQEASDIVFRWNTLNRPKKAANELKKEINVFWHESQYKYDGKEFSDSALQELNKRFIDEETTFFISEEVNDFHYDNQLFHPEVFPKLKALTFAVISFIKLESEGIRREHLADLCERHYRDKNLKAAIEESENLGYIKMVRKGREIRYVYIEKINATRGYTAVSKLLHRLFIKKDLTQSDYKLLLMLENYAYNGKREIWPGNIELSFRTGQTTRSIRENLKRLEYKKYIKIEQKKGERHIKLLY